MFLKNRFELFVIMTSITVIKYDNQDFVSSIIAIKICN